MHRRTTLSLGLAVLSALSLVLAATPAAAEHFVGQQDLDQLQSNNTCANEGFGWQELKLEGSDLSDGTYSDGVLTIELHITGFTGDNDNEPKVFDWQSLSVRVIAVFVKGGQDSRYYGYAHPGAVSDTGLTTPHDEGNAVSHISFCYEDEPVPVPELSTIVLTATAVVGLAGVVALRRRL